MKKMKMMMKLLIVEEVLKEKKIYDLDFVKEFNFGYRVFIDVSFVFVNFVFKIEMKNFNCEIDLLGILFE